MRSVRQELASVGSKPDARLRAAPARGEGRVSYEDWLKLVQAQHDRTAGHPADAFLDIAVVGLKVLFGALCLAALGSCLWLMSAVQAAS